MRKIKWLWWFIRYVFGFRHYIYSTKPIRIADIKDMAFLPSEKELVVSADYIMRFLSKGKRSLPVETIECRCRICRRKFWSIPRTPTCENRSCYMEFHLHPGKYPLLIYPGVIKARRALKETQS